MPALNLSSALAIAILLEPASLSDKAVPSGCGQRSRRFETRCCSGNELCPIGICWPRVSRCFRIEFLFVVVARLSKDINPAFKSEGAGLPGRLEQQSCRNVTSPALPVPFLFINRRPITATSSSRLKTPFLSIAHTEDTNRYVKWGAYWYKPTWMVMFFLGRHFPRLFPLHLLFHSVQHLHVFN
jgi:hypothetical protein